jgi:hypothetical protein
MYVAKRWREEADADRLVDVWWRPGIVIILLVGIPECDLRCIRCSRIG